MFRSLRQTKQQVEQVGVYIQGTIENFEENKDAYKAAAAGLVVGALIVSTLKSRPVVIHNNIVMCSHG